MSELNIYTLLMMVRGFSNEVTVNWLASQLGISYSTLARCKSGAWPRSVTFDAMKGVFDVCRDRFFDGDGSALVESALGYLERQGVATGNLASVYADAGYDAFAGALISAAHELDESPRKQRGNANAAPASSEGAVGTEAGGISVAGGFSGVVVALPVTVILLIGLLNVPLGNLFGWAVDNLYAFAAILLAIAALPVVLGSLVDAPLAWRAYRKAHPDAPEARRDRRSFRRVAKYGGIDEVVPGAGRFDLSRQHCEYQLACNVLGAMCSVSLLAFLVRQPGFTGFFASHQWTEFFKVGLAVGFFVAYGHNREHRNLPACAQAGARYNPDNYLPSRVHVWANTLHLVITFSLVCVLTLGLLAYSIANFRMRPAPLLILWPFAQTVVFLVWEGVSPIAEKMESLGVGAFVPGVIASSVGVAALVAVCYRPSWEGAAICLVCAVCLAGVLVWFRSFSSGNVSAWVERGRHSGAYSLAVVAALAAMFVISVVTSALT